ncbi:hypothetical protein AB2S62_06820 [Vibrio sp. NTOU-M3]|uniref:hypothetical protein n=1 Tax=Vibrio sp. NTOU-M3 TaxID=3234954 RepID=UPI00349F7BA3
MKTTSVAIVISVLFLSACGSSDKLTVFDGLTYTAQNDGGFNDPIRLYPLQTTQISLDGQLTYNIGDICYVDKNRSPMTSICFTEEESNKVLDSKVIKHSYSVSNESTKSSSSLPDIRNLASSLSNAIDRATLAIATCSDSQCLASVTKDESIKDASTQFRNALNQKNVTVYNWSDTIAGSASAANDNIKASSKSSDNGFTVVSGFDVYNLQLKCIHKDRIKSKKSHYLKVVTKLKSAESISFVNTQSKLAQFNATIDAAKLRNKTPAYLQELAKLELAVGSASTLSTMGSYETNGPSIVEKPTTTKSVYFAVLTDLDDLKDYYPACSEEK